MIQSLAVIAAKVDFSSDGVRIGSLCMATMLRSSKCIAPLLSAAKIIPDSGNWIGGLVFLLLPRGMMSAFLGRQGPLTNAQQKA
jgi:hypothetical protein